MFTSEDRISDGPPASETGRSQIEVEDSLQAVGFGGQFGAKPGAQILCFSCHETFAASTQDADSVSRVEGESDPADMSIVVPLTCPKCDTSGTLTLQYGPEASIEESDVLAALPRNPASHTT